MIRGALLAVAFAALPLAAAPVPKEIKKEGKLEGTWKVESIVIFGQPSTESLYWTIDAEGNLVRHSDPIAPANAGRSIVLKQDPGVKSLDYVSGQMTFLGVYRLGGDTLEFCLAKQGEERPAAIAATPLTYLWTLKRVKPEVKK